jgi:hypothetical protein
MEIFEPCGQWMRLFCGCDICGFLSHFQPLVELVVKNQTQIGDAMTTLSMNSGSLSLYLISTALDR